MFRLAVFCVLASVPAFAQQPTGAAKEPPPEVDAALRARVQQFYQAHVDRKYRKADEVVAEESKDAFYEATKPTVRGFEIKEIAYSDEFTKAVVTVLADSEFVIPGHGSYPIKRGLLSDWKVVDGQWFLFIDTSVLDTPFGKIKAQPGQPGPAAPPSFPMSAGPTAADLSKILKADKTEIQLTPAAPTAEVTLTTSMGGDATLVFTPPAVPGLTATLDRQNINAKQPAKLTIRWEGKGKMPAGPVPIEIALKQVPFSAQVKVTFANDK